MTRNEYLGALRQELRSLPLQEQEEALRYYEEYFDDAGPENEQQVIAELGSPRELARNIVENSVFSLTRAPQPEPGQEQENAFRQMEPPARQKQGRGAAFWILVILSSVIWLPLLIGFAACILGVLAGLVALLAGIAVAAAALVIAAFFCIGFGLPLFASSPADGILLIGLALVQLGGALLCGIICYLVCGKFIPWCWRKGKGMWQRQREKRGQTPVTGKE